MQTAFTFIPSLAVNSKQIKVILSAAQRHHIFSSPEPEAPGELIV